MLFYDHKLKYIFYISLIYFFFLKNNSYHIKINKLTLHYLFFTDAFFSFTWNLRWIHLELRSYFFTSRINSYFSEYVVAD